MAQRGAVAQQAERVRRLPGGRRVPGPGAVHRAVARHHPGRLQRRAAGGRLHQPAPRPLRGRHRAGRVSPERAGCVYSLTSLHECSYKKDIHDVIIICEPFTFYRVFT